MSRKFVCNVTPTGRFRLRPGRWWEPTFVVEIEEQLDYQPTPSIAWNYEESDFVWRKARTLDMMRVPAEIFEPRYISREAGRTMIADTFDHQPDIEVEHTLDPTAYSVFVRYSGGTLVVQERNHV